VQMPQGQLQCHYQWQAGTGGLVARQDVRGQVPIVMCVLHACLGGQCCHCS